MSFGIMNNLLNECLGYMKIPFQKKNYISGIVIGKCFFFLEILISPLPSTNKFTCILVLDNFSYNINADKEHHFRPLFREMKKLDC